MLYNITIKKKRGKITMTKDLRNELEIALTNHNKKFEQLTQQAVNCENEEEKKSLFQKRWQFIHDYAQFLNDFV